MGAWIAAPSSKGVEYERPNRNIRWFLSRRPAIRLSGLRVLSLLWEKEQPSALPLLAYLSESVLRRHSGVGLPGILLYLSLPQE